MEADEPGSNPESLVSLATSAISATSPISTSLAPTNPGFEIDLHQE
jgi:hypothetical protein